MFINSIKVAIRNLWRDRRYAAINLLGLSLGLASSFLLLLLVKYHFTFENFYQDSSRIFRLAIHYNIGGQEDTYCNVPRPVGPAFYEEYPEVESFTRMRGMNGLETHKAHLKYEDQHYVAKDIYIVDSTFFKVFDREFIEGDKNSSLSRPNTIVLSESLAKSIFNDINPIGKRVQVDENGKKLEVTGVFENVPNNTHIPFDALVSWNNYFPRQNPVWYGLHVYTYVKLSNPMDAHVLLERFPMFFDHYMSDRFGELNGSADLIIQPLKDIHLRSDLTWEANQNGDLTSTLILLGIGVFLMVIAEINYLNLSLARNSTRRKEIAIRKILGASKIKISSQFLIETFLFKLVSLFIALIIVKVFYQQFINISGIDVSPFQVDHLLALCLTAFGVGFLISAYPTLVLSGTNSVEALKGKSRQSIKGGKMQRILVVVQFALSTIVILFTFTVGNQLSYLSRKDLGFNKEDVVVFEFADTVLTLNSALIRDQILTIPGVSKATFSLNRPGVDLNHTTAYIENDGNFTSSGFQFMIVDASFLNTLEFQLEDGRNFISGSEKDYYGSIIINEAASKKFGWKDHPIGKRIRFGVDNDDPRSFREVIGVLKDFNVGSLHNRIDPIVIFPEFEYGEQLIVRLEADGDQSKTVNRIERLLNGYEPQIPVTRNFLSDELDHLYADENTLFKSMSYLGVLTILISVLGFVGLLSFSINQREKEIGIRKVLGARVRDVIFMFYKEILILIFIAEVIAIPFNQFLADSWLKNFQYHSSPGLMQLGVVLFMVICLSLFIISLQIRRAANMNPVEVIKDE